MNNLNGMQEEAREEQNAPKDLIYVVVLEMDGKAVIMDCFDDYAEARAYARHSTKKYRADGYMIKGRPLHKTS